MSNKDEKIEDIIKIFEKIKEKLENLNEDDKFGEEVDGKQTFRRLAGTWTYWGWKHGYFASEEDAKAYFDEMCYMLASQMVAPNSPQTNVF